VLGEIGFHISQFGIDLGNGKVEFHPANLTTKNMRP
jgi:hypothetical protein